MRLPIFRGLKWTSIAFIAIVAGSVILGSIWFCALLLHGFATFLRKF